MKEDRYGEEGIQARGDHRDKIAPHMPPPRHLQGVAAGPRMDGSVQATEEEVTSARAPSHGQSRMTRHDWGAPAVDGRRIHR